MPIIDPDTITTYLICAAPLQAFKSAILIPKYINYARGKNLDEKPVDDESFPMYALPFCFDAVYFVSIMTKIALEEMNVIQKPYKQKVKFEKVKESDLENKVNKNF